VVPTVEEVSAYCRDRDNGIDPDQFIDFYTARDWKFGPGKPVADWQACIRTWEQNPKHSHESNGQAKKTPAQLALERFGNDEN
jgi:hypothetical protein